MKKLPACPPTQRFKVRKGWRLDILPLFGSRARIVHTDGVSIDEFW